MATFKWFAYNRNNFDIAKIFDKLEDAKIYMTKQGGPTTIFPLDYDRKTPITDRGPIMYIQVSYPNRQAEWFETRGNSISYNEVLEIFFYMCKKKIPIGMN